MLSFLTKVFGSKNDREVKRMQPVVDRINALEAGMQAMSDEELRAQTGRFRERVANGEPLDDLLPEAFAAVREASVRSLKMRHFDVQLIGGMVLHDGKIAEMKTGEGKTLVATLPAYLNALTGNGMHIVTVNDYLARRDTEWMGHLYHFLGLRVGTILHGLDGRRAAGGLRGRHHLRDQQRVRVRLPARQHEVRPREPGPARAQLRDRRRGGQHPDRRGAHPAHHLGPGREVHRPLLPGQRGHPQAAEGARLHRRREGARLDPHRGGGGPLREDAPGREPLRPQVHRDPAPHQPGAQGARPLQARRRLHRQGRRGHHRRRVHGPAHAGPALQRRAAPGPRGQGRGQDREREPDPRHDHLPELFPHVQEAGGHDRHGRHRGGRVQEDLQPRRRRRPHQHAHDPHGLPGRDLQDQAREVRGRAGRDRGAAREGPARAGRHHLDRRLRAAQQDAQGARHPARGAQRQAPRAGGARSSPRPARRPRSRSPPTWPAAAPTSSWGRG